MVKQVGLSPILLSSDQIEEISSVAILFLDILRSLLAKGIILLKRLHVRTNPNFPLVKSFMSDTLNWLPITFGCQ